MKSEEKKKRYTHNRIVAFTSKCGKILTVIESYNKHKQQKTQPGQYRYETKRPARPTNK